MHIPDGLLNVGTTGLAAGAAALGVGTAWLLARERLPRCGAPAMALTASFVFGAQMLNYPVLPGTSGHLVGAALSALLLGPGPAVIVVTAVLLVQCLLFADGGLLALGANVLNMAVCGSVTAWAVHALARRWLPGAAGRVAAVALAAWASVVAASMLCAVELAASGLAPWTVLFTAMVGVHLLIGLGEAVITLLVLGVMGRLGAEGPVWIPTGAAGRSQSAALGMPICLTLALLAAPLACGWEDGLERVLARADIAASERGAEASVPPAAAAFTPASAWEWSARAPMPDYLLPGTSDPGLATLAAGSIGAALVLGIVLLMARLMARRSPVVQAPSGPDTDRPPGGHGGA